MTDGGWIDYDTLLSIWLRCGPDSAAGGAAEQVLVEHLGSRATLEEVVRARAELGLPLPATWNGPVPDGRMASPVIRSRSLRRLSLPDLRPQLRKTFMDLLDDLGPPRSYISSASASSGAN